MEITKNSSTNSTSSNMKLSDPWKGQEVNEGDGAIVYRVIGLNKISDIDPFLLMDFFENSVLPGGFPDHPHRGFETVTYLLSGKFYHEDFQGRKGVIEPGDIQWMTAGKGIVHAEMPYSFTEPTKGFQLWINLSKENKMIDPYYQEIKKDKISTIDKGNYKITLIAGKIGDVEGPCKSTTPTSYFDVTIEKNTEVKIPIEKNMSGFLFLFEGKDLKVNDEKTVGKNYAVRFDLADEDGELKFNTKDNQCRFLLIFGRPLKEPIAKYGPFVMNTQKELEEAYNDYKESKNGFEARKTWKSEIQNLVNENFKMEL